MKKQTTFCLLGVFLILAGGCSGNMISQSGISQTTISQKDLVSDLMRRSDVIPYAGTAGGTMRIYAEDAIHFIDERTVFASFEDGHRAGTMTLHYTVDKTGAIDWTLISSECDGCQKK